jgi:hypothetical protein
MDGSIVEESGTINSVIVSFPVFLANHGTLGFDQLKNLLAPLLLLFWQKLSVCVVRKHFTQLVFVQLDGFGHGAVLELGWS